MKTALVTGSAGFIGRHMSVALADAGYEVTGLDTAYRHASPSQPGVARATAMDARDFFRHAGGGFDVVVHAAAAGADRASIDGSPLALAANLELDAALFQWAARTGPGRVVYLSSSAAYPVRLQTAEWVATYGSTHLAEYHINLTRWGKTGDWSPDAIYGWIKLTGEMLAGHARDEGVPVTIVRPFSGYGEDQGGRFPFGALAARALAREDPFVIWGTGQQVRDFVHVDDICAALMTMIGEGIDGPVNIGTGRATSMLALAGAMCAEAGYWPEFRPLPDKPSGVAWRVADITQMSEFFKPAVSLEEGIERAMRVLRPGGL